MSNNNGIGKNENLNGGIPLMYPETQLHYSVPVLISDKIVVEANSGDEGSRLYSLSKSVDNKLPIFNKRFGKPVQWEVGIELKEYLNEDSDADLTVSLSTNSVSRGELKIIYTLKRTNKGWKIVAFRNDDEGIDNKYDTPTHDYPFQEVFEITEPMRRLGEAKWVLSQLYGRYHKLLPND